MIKLKDILLENDAPNIFIPRRLEDRIERLVSLYIRNGSKGDLDLSDMNLTVLPDILKDISVGGSFYCSFNYLTSLENCPKTVGGNFFCSRNKLTSLKGAPKSVGKDFVCYNNPGKFTKEQVRAVCNVKGDIYDVL
jgi:hypothetical protein